MKIIELSSLNSIEQIKAIKELQIFLSDLILEYPLHNIWYKKMIKSMKCNYDRIILLAIENNVIVGTAILKNTEIEKKICTLRMAKNFQKRGIGKELLGKSMEILANDKPIITVSQHRNDEFIKLFKYYGFNLESVYKGKYQNNIYEYVYNGILLPETLINKEIEIVEDKIKSSNLFYEYNGKLFLGRGSSLISA